MWTEREKELTDLTNIEKYLDEMDNFHDYMIGNISYNSEKQEASICVETEHDVRNSSKEGLIWNFDFEQVTNILIGVDSMLSCYVHEITVEDGQVHFWLTNGNIYVTANKVELGIPCKDK